MKNADPLLFPRDYYDSRKRFLDLCSEISGGQVEHWKIPGKSDDDLFTDAVYWRPIEKPDFILVVTSGIHGSETYAGSAILQLLLKEFLPKLDRRNAGVLLVHAMNPYGFKHHRRTTENGVNLNRNFSISGELYKSRNLESEKMHELFFNSSPVTSHESTLMRALEVRNGVAWFGEVSMDQFTKATAPGQFVTPRHLEYGGQALEPQSFKLVEKLKSLLPQYKDVLALDLHTGLGDKNRLHLLTSGSGKDLHPELFAELFDPSADREFYEHTPASADGFYEVHGALNCAFADLAKTQQRICAITMEFGTFGHSLEAQLKGVNNFVLEHQGFYNGYDNESLKAEIQKECFERSYPQNDDWRAAVIAASRGLFEAVGRRAKLFKS